MTNIDTATGFPGLKFDNSYARLPERFYVRVNAREAKSPELVKLNEPLAAELGLDLAAIDREKLARILSGNDLPGDGTLLAMAYSGHQFGQFNPGLGDGRAGLIGEVIDVYGMRRDVQLKGSGPTPFSRSGDGLAALGPVMREYIVSEAMNALGIPTTRSLAIVLTGDAVFRERLHPGAVLTRIADSHLRIGTFQYFAARQDEEAIRKLVGYALDRHYPELKDADNPAMSLLESVVERQASLVAKWMSIGFIHGVMNTDNMTISGETIDYGPCAFMDHYDHGKVFSSIDQQGRYAYGAQPQIAQWNLARLAETLVSQIDGDEDKAIEMATGVINGFAQHFSTCWHREMAAKFGFSVELPPEADDWQAVQEKQAELIRGFVSLMHKHGADFTSTFSTLARSVLSGFNEDELSDIFKADAQFEPWFQNWRAALENARNGNAKEIGGRMQAANPVYIPRNHLVEEAIRAGEDEADLSAMERLLEAVLSPFEERPGFERYALPPRPGEEVRQTFCGT